MYKTFMYTLRSFFGYGCMRIIMIVAVSFCGVILAANTSISFRNIMCRLSKKDGWKGGFFGFCSALFKMLMVFVLVRLFITLLVFQAGLFEKQHGRITERNRSAVLLKWGYPHEQGELRVSHTRKRVWVTRQLMILEIHEGKEREKVFSESYWKDEGKPVMAIGGKMPEIISVAEEDKDYPVVQKSIISGDVDIRVKNNPRRLGNANYAGYEDEWKFKYEIANRSQWETKALFCFPFPAKTGLFDDMFLSVNGKNMLDYSQSDESGLVWHQKMEPGQKLSVEIGYKSRGLEYLRYIPRRMTQTAHYRVNMFIDGIKADKLDYPIGSMPPSEKLADIKENPFKLTWELDNALTSYDIGVKLPEATQPKYYFSRLLDEAPVGLVLLFVGLTLPRMVIGRRLRMELLAIFGTAYCLHYTFMGRLAEVMSGFAFPFLISLIMLTLLIVWFRIKDSEWLFLRVQDSIVFYLAIFLYPLSVVDEDHTALWMQFFCLGILIHVCILAIKRAVRSAAKEEFVHR